MSPYLEPKRGHLSSSDTFQSRSSHDEFHSEPLDASSSSSNNGVSPGSKLSSHTNSWQDQMETNMQLQYLQTFSGDEALVIDNRDQLAVEYRRQSTLPPPRSLLQEHYRALPLPLRASMDSEAGGKPRSFTLPRDSGLHAILAATAAASEQREPQHYRLERPGDCSKRNTILISKEILKRTKQNIASRQNDTLVPEANQQLQHLHFSNAQFTEHDGWRQ